MVKPRLKRRRRQFSEDFKAETVRLVREGGKGVTEVARDLELTRSAVQRWVDQAEIEAGRGPTGALTRAERAELVQLRRENVRLRMEREILKKATAFFAKEHA
jgi:transposase